MADMRVDSLGFVLGILAASGLFVPDLPCMHSEHDAWSWLSVGRGLASSTACQMLKEGHLV